MSLLRSIDIFGSMLATNAVALVGCEPANAAGT